MTRARTSSSSPRASWSSKRSSSLRSSSARSSSSPMMIALVAGYSSRPGPKEENRRPVPSITSSARTILRRFVGSTRVAATGSRSLSLLNSSSRPPGRSASCSSSAASSGKRPGRAERVEHCPVVEARAPYEKRHVTAGVDAGKRPAGLGLELGHGELLGGIDDVDQMPGRDRLLGGGRLGGSDVEMAVDGHGVDRDQLVAVRGRDRASSRASAVLPVPVAPTMTTRGASGACGRLDGSQSSSVGAPIGGWLGAPWRGRERCTRRSCSRVIRWRRLGHGGLERLFGQHEPSPWRESSDRAR